LDLAIPHSKVWSQQIAQRKCFWLILGLSANLGLGESLGKRLIQKLK